MFERFTDRARRVVVTAQEEARMLGHNHIGSEHLLLGLLREQDGVAAHALEAAGITAEAVRTQVEELAGSGEKSPARNIPFTQRAKKILELSLREALEQKKNFIGTEHILLGLIRDADGVGARILGQLGGPLPALRQRVIEMAATAAPEPAAARWEANSGGWDWQPAQVFTREARLQPEAAVGFRKLLTSIDRRLAGIEHRLKITAEEKTAGGFRGLLMSIDRHLANIEHHLEITAGEKPGEPPAPAD